MEATIRFKLWLRDIMEQKPVSEWPDAAFIYEMLDQAIKNDLLKTKLTPEEKSKWFYSNIEELYGLGHTTDETLN
jgi:hypothetical protein